jgi:hypothetical protein
VCCSSGIDTRAADEVGGGKDHMSQSEVIPREALAGSPKADIAG